MVATQHPEQEWQESSAAGELLEQSWKYQVKTSEAQFTLRKQNDF